MTQRRGNGLLADAYVPLVLLAPLHADRMLEALRRKGIAAYAVPLEEDVLEPSGGAEDPPTDHLYVDADERAEAERVLGTELPHLGAQNPLPTGDADPDTGAADPRAPVGGDLLEGPSENTGSDTAPGAGEDEVWKDLVSRFYEDDAPERDLRSWPDAENLGAPPRDEEPAASGDLLADGPDREEEDRRTEADLEGHYEPPPPPPLLQGDRTGIAAWFGFLGSPALVFGITFLGLPRPNWLVFLAVLVCLACFVVLILRMNDRRPPGDGGPDDGAVV
ncbi:hypothetical protein ACOALZ_10505 [Nocardiopsis algeriensis]|uniref:hypothetical protein n=1 Tax=Nocardiopsis algeriensis TaxID=1478215 RepID=UPI003B43B5BC